MSNENLFDEGTTNTNIEQTATTTIAIPDNVKDMIGDGKKYSSVEKALEALGHSQAHIAKIEQENAQLRDKAGQAVDSQELYKTVQELLEKERETHGSAPLDVASLEALLDRKLTDRETQKIEKDNASTVKDALVKKYQTKEKAQEVFDARAKELGIDLTKMAKTSPRAALELLGIKSDSSPTPGVTRGGVNTEALKHTQEAAPVQHKSVMGGHTTNQLLDAWRAAAPKTS